MGVAVNPVDAPIAQLDVVILTRVRIGRPPFPVQAPRSRKVNDPASKHGSAHVVESSGAFEDLEGQWRPKRAQRHARDDR